MANVTQPNDWPQWRGPPLPRPDTGKHLNKRPIDGLDEHSDSSDEQHQCKYMEKFRLSKLQENNLQIDIDDLRKELKKYKDEKEIYVKINEELAHIKAAYSRANSDSASLTSTQMETRRLTFIKEVNTHLGLCNVAIVRIPYEEIKLSLQRISKKENSSFCTAEKKFMRDVKLRKVYEKCRMFFFLFGVVGMLFLIISFIWPFIF